MRVISVRENPEYADIAIQYFQKRWANENSAMVYEDCIRHCLDAAAQLPQWYLLMDGQNVAGGAGLITNDFISRMDLYPWLCALYIEPQYRGSARSGLLIGRCKEDAKRFGYQKLYLCSDHVGFYERFGFARIGTGYHPWGETSGIFEVSL